MSDKLLKKAINKHKAGQYRDAQTLYRKILKSQPQHIDANYMLGTLLAEQGDAPSAMKYIRLAEQQAPGSQYIKNNLGNVYRMLGDYENAAAKYQEALAIQPDMTQALNNLAIVNRRLNNNSEAITLYKSAIAVSPNFTEAHFNLGKSYWDDGQYENAQACFQRVLEIDPEHALAFHELGNYYLKHGDREQAISCFEKYLSLAPSDACGARLKLSYLNAGEMPQRQPEQLVIQTYEKKARTWDSDVDRADMAFLGPQHIGDMVAQLFNERQHLAILDIGCGTGLCAPFLKNRARLLNGVDVSPHMLELARGKNLYDDLVCDDIVNYLKSAKIDYDLITGSGVLIFFGDLHPVLAAAQQRVASAGYFVFTLYKSDVADIAIRDNMHFAHSDTYIRNTAADTGWDVLEIKTVVHEYEHEQPQPGFIVSLKKAH